MLTPRENLPPRYLPRRERQYSIVDGLYGRLFAAAPTHLYTWLPGRLREVILRRLEAEAAKMWSFVRKKTNRY